jgi:nitrogen PTS system EIIA component
VARGLRAAGREAALRAVVEHMPLPAAVDREFFLGVLLAREDMASTGVGEGVAIPHVRNAIVLPISEPVITLGLLETPVDFGAVDGQPVFALFALVCPSVRMHLHLLSRLAFALRDTAFRSALDRRAPAEEIIAAARAAESAVGASGRGA